MKNIIIFPFCFFLLCIHNVHYGVKINWYLTFINNRNNEISIHIEKESPENSWDNPDWVNSGKNEIIVIPPNSNLKVDIELSSKYIDEEPIVRKNSDYLFHILIDNTDSIDINLFPFPEYESHVLCSEYYYVNSDTSQASYNCSSVFFDTLTIYDDSVISTTNYYKLFQK